MMTSKAAPTKESMLDFEQKAESAYAEMYDAEPWNQKDLKDDALSFLARAIDVAEALGLEEDAARLRARVDNIVRVYDSQFRGKWR